MNELSGAAGFAEETVFLLRIGKAAGAGHFDGHHAIEIRFGLPGEVKKRPRMEHGKNTD